MRDTIDEAASLTALSLPHQEPIELEFAHDHAAQGMGGSGAPVQVVVLWLNGRTLVYPARLPDGFPLRCAVGVRGHCQPAGLRCLAESEDCPATSARRVGRNRWQMKFDLEEAQMINPYCI